MTKKKFCTGKVGKVSFLGAALFSAMCMFSVTVFAGPGDDDDTGGSTTGTPEPSFHQLSMQLSLNGVPVNLTPDMQTAIQNIINANANLSQQETPSDMPSVTPNVTSQMLNFNDSGNDSLDDFFFDDSDYAEFERVCDAPNTAPPTGTDVELSPIDSVDNQDALSDDSSVAIRQPARRFDSRRFCDERYVAQNVLFELGEFLQYSRLTFPYQKAKIINLASDYLGCPELRVAEKDSQNFSHIYEKLCQNPELLQKLQTLIGNTGFKNYASQYKDKRMPRVKSNTVLTEAGDKLQHNLLRFAWGGNLVSAGSKADSISKKISINVCSFVLSRFGIPHKFTRDEKRIKIVLLNNMALKYGGAFNAFFRDPALMANCAQWCKDSGNVKKPNRRKF